MKNQNLNFNALSKAEMKNITAGEEPACFWLGASCNADVQCCSTNCNVDGQDHATGKTCQ